MSTRDKLVQSILDLEARIVRAHEKADEAEATGSHSVEEIARTRAVTIPRLEARRDYLQRGLDKFDAR